MMSERNSRASRRVIAVAVEGVEFSRWPLERNVAVGWEADGNERWGEERCTEVFVLQVTAGFGFGFGDGGGLVGEVADEHFLGRLVH